MLSAARARVEHAVAESVSASTLESLRAAETTEDLQQALASAEAHAAALPEQAATRVHASLAFPPG